MAGLQRFVTYIYRYENEEKRENAGFAKTEVRGGTCRVEVHIRNANIEQPECTVCLFARNHESILAVPVGNISMKRGNGDVRYSFDTKELNSFGVSMEQMEGIFIPLDRRDYLASQWKEGELRRGRVKMLEKKEEREAGEKRGEETQPDAEGRRQTAGEEPVEKRREETQPDALGERQTEKEEPAEKREQKMQPDVGGERQTAGEEPIEMQQGAEGEREQTAGAKAEDKRNQATKAPGARQQEEENLQATELPMEKFFEESGWEGVFQKLRLKLTVFFPFEGQEIECIRMELKDLHEFPKKYWYLGNNSFLLHGFFNYRHVVLGEMTENGRKEYFIGVPGVFQNQERIMAAMFGFPEFRTARTSEHKTGNFGYWYRII